MSRDLKADLELCNKATPGPWIDNGNEIVVPSNPNEGIAGALTDEDNAFISQAREGWPHAIERALYMEELVKELVQELENVVCFIETMECRHVSESVGKDFVGYKCDGNSHWIGDILGDIEIMVNKAKEVLGDVSD